MFCCIKYVPTKIASTKRVKETLLVAKIVILINTSNQSDECIYKYSRTSVQNFELSHHSSTSCLKSSDLAETGFTIIERYRSLGGSFLLALPR